MTIEARLAEHAAQAGALPATGSELGFVTAMRAFAAAGVGYGWMQQVIRMGMERERTLRRREKPKPLSDDGPDADLYERCGICDGSGATVPVGCDDADCIACSGRGYVKIGVTVRQLERMADRERAAMGDPGIPADRRRKILERLREKVAAALDRLGAES